VEVEARVGGAGERIRGRAAVEHPQKEGGHEIVERGLITLVSVRAPLQPGRRKRSLFHDVADIREVRRLVRRLSHGDDPGVDGPEQHEQRQGNPDEAARVHCNFSR
jgi:hypothetical protein